MAEDNKTQIADVQVAAACLRDGESDKRFAERVEIEAKLADMDKSARDAFADFGEKVFSRACEDDCLAATLGEVFDDAKRQLQERQELVNRLEELEAKRLLKLEKRRQYEEADAAAKALDEEAKRLEAEARQAQEEADRLAREAQERADQLNALLEEGLRKHDEAVREAEEARAAAENTMLFDFVESVEDSESGLDEDESVDAPSGEQALQDSFETPIPETADASDQQVSHESQVANETIAVGVGDLSISGSEGQQQEDRLIANGDETLASLAADFSICPYCGSSVGDKDSFCMECGFQLKQPHICPHCGNAYQPEDTFCMMCGNEL